MLILLALALMFSAYRRVHNPLRFTGQSITVQGEVMEKLVEQHNDRFLPFPVTAYVVRYAFPNAQGQMRTGQQVVTRAFYDQLLGQGSPVWVTVDTADSSINAVDPRLTFPGIAGWRLGIGLGTLLAAAVLINAVLVWTRQPAA